MCVWVKTIKKEQKELKNIFQSDYKYSWDNNLKSKNLASRANDDLKRYSKLYPFVRKFYRLLGFKNLVSYLRYLFVYKRLENYKTVLKKLT